MTRAKISGLGGLVLLASLLMMGIISTKVQAAGELVTVTLTPSDTSIEVGENVTVAIAVTSNGSPTGFQGPILYDSSKLSFVSCSAVGSNACLDNGAGQFTVTSGNLPANGQSATLATVTLSAIASGAAAVTVSGDCNASEGAPLFTTTECIAVDTSITVAGPAPDPDTSSFSIAGTEVEEGEIATLTVTRDPNGTPGAVIITCNPSIGGGTAESGDFVDENDTISFGADDTEGTCQVQTNTDVDFADETFRVAITANVQTVIVGGQATVVITDPDIEPPSPGVVRFVDSNSSVNESSPGTKFVDVERVSGTAGSISVVCTVTVSGTATSGLDYTATTSQTLEWADGDDSDESCEYTLINDSLVETTETIILTLGNIDGGSIGSPSTHTVSIIDDEAPPVLTPTPTATATNRPPKTGTPVPTKPATATNTVRPTDTALPTNTQAGRTNTPAPTNTATSTAIASGTAGASPTNTGVVGGATSTPTRSGTAPLPPATGSGSNFGGTSAVAALFLVAIGLGVSGFAATRVTRKR